MTFTFQPDPAIANVNSFCTVAQADDYHSTKLNTAWAGLSQDNKEKLLAWATRQLDSLSYVGIKTIPSQPLQWPRTWVAVDGGYSGYTGLTSESANSIYYLDPLTFPKFLYEASAEMAGILMAGDVTLDSGLGLFDKIKVDVVELQMKKYSKNPWLKDSVRTLLQRYLLNFSPYSVPTQRIG